MISADNLFRWFERHPVLNRKRILFAFVVAVFTDLVQLTLGPLGWAFVDEGLDVVAMILISWGIGFHMLLLPTFLVEFIPGPDMLPTWTACTAAVVMLRKRAQQRTQPTIDISSEVTPVPTPPIIEGETQAPPKSSGGSDGLAKDSKA
jgi:hypothetical protein